MYITEIIKQEYQKWNIGDCIFLEAPTGTGKTTFILKELLPFVKSLNMEILYLSNRFLLKEQIKKEIAEKQGLPTDLAWLESVEELDGITVISYQKLQLLCQQEGFVWEINRRYRYVVCDEIHYLLEDSAFNPEIIWLVRFLKDISSCLICISATLGELKEWIVWEKYGVNVRYMKWVRENDFFEYLMFPKRFTTPMTLIYTTIHSYTIPAHSVVEKVVYYAEQEQIIDAIGRSKLGEKWLIFQSNKSKAKELTKKLGDSAALITAEDRENDTIAEIIHEGKFSCKVLVATKLLDNGVSLKDSHLKNIIIDTISRTEFVQMLGRKRSLDLNDTVRLYIPKKSKKTFQGYLSPEMQETYDLVEKDFSPNEMIAKMLCDEKIYSKVRRFFTLEKGQLVKNPLAIEYYARQRKLVDKMITEFSSDEFAFIKEQLSWIDMEDTFNEKNFYTFQQQEDAISHIRDKLAELVGCELCQSEQEELRTFITERANDSRIRTQKGNRLLGKKAINELLQEYTLPFQIEGIYGKRKGEETFWVVKRREK
ncbi:DEAD/DEAH box helicase [Holdemanella porci]|uniref:DEAD/DEAH box helicase n=1 Tax=Holdemanella porci TaxID=2652276 RepID=UPI00388DA08A